MKRDAIAPLSSRHIKRSIIIAVSTCIIWKYVPLPREGMYTSPQDFSLLSFCSHLHVGPFLNHVEDSHARSVLDDIEVRKCALALKSLLTLQ